MRAMNLTPIPLMYVESEGVRPKHYVRLDQVLRWHIQDYTSVTQVHAVVDDGDRKQHHLVMFEADGMEACDEWVRTKLTAIGFAVSAIEEPTVQMSEDEFRDAVRARFGEEPERRFGAR